MNLGENVLVHDSYKRVAELNKGRTEPLVVSGCSSNVGDAMRAGIVTVRGDDRPTERSGTSRALEKQRNRAKEKWEAVQLLFSAMSWWRSGRDR